MTDTWDGKDRRAADQHLVAAMGDVRALKVGVVDLAEAVRLKTIEFQRVIRQVAILLAVLLVILVGFSLWQVARLNERLDRGHNTITCLLLLEPTSRTAQTIVDCQRGG